MKQNPLRTAPAAGVEPGQSKGAVVRVLPFQGDDRELAEALLKGHSAAPAWFYDRFATWVHRLCYRLLGRDSELDDAVQETFLRALESVHRLRNPNALRAWVTSVTIMTVRIRLQRRARNRWLRFLPSEDVELAGRMPRPEHSEALRAAYGLLEQMGADERIVFVLRHIEGMTVLEMASACSVSESTVKRRLRRADRTFLSGATSLPALEEWLSEGGGR